MRIINTVINNNAPTNPSSSTIIEKIKSTLINVGFDVITYKWLLKALDNVEEIIVADSSTKPPTTANPNVGTSNKGTSNKTDLKDYLDNKNTSTNKPNEDEFVPPAIEDSDESFW